ncbi:uncharacterized protein AB675_1272 [Cyphellophora attinorum]|uniref:Uncharacterized protein n=1 Tax=Cyphellophora attinorum TaxID=1664694 RepID=A0A0N0NIF0_9EURO|nr:uncharacterized protein AB675_1272 [Phialophora attinorum]KPI35668.1 hypothetical protein AB675_1272 [Phialophora attinorum]
MAEVSSSSKRRLSDTASGPVQDDEEVFIVERILAEILATYWEEEAKGELPDAAYIAKVEFLMAAREQRERAESEAAESVVSVSSNNTAVGRSPKRVKVDPPRLSKHIAQPPPPKKKPPLPPSTNLSSGTSTAPRPIQPLKPVRPRSDYIASSTTLKAKPSATLKISTFNASKPKPQGPSLAKKSVSLASKPSATSKPLQQKKPSEPGVMDHTKRFRNLQHWGNAKKKAAQEPPVDPDDPNLKMVGARSPLQSRSQSPDSQAMFYPEQEVVAFPIGADAKDSPADMAPPEHSELPTFTRTLLTKPKLNGLNQCDETARRPLDRIAEAVPTPFQSADVDPDKLSKDRNSVRESPQATAASPQANRQTGALENDSRHSPQIHGDRSLLMATQPKQPQAVTAQAPTHHAPAQEAIPTMRGKNGRSWAADEVVVHLSLGDYNIGPVKLAGYPTIVRAALINYKRNHDASVVEVHFAQGDVLNPIEYQTRALDFIHSNHHTAGVIPFDDTAKVCEELAHGYLIPHDLSAVWILNSTTPLAFVLHSPDHPHGWQGMDIDSPTLR